MTTEDPIGIPFEEAHWDLAPGHTALVVIDPQNDFLHTDGWYAQKGIDISHMRRVIEPTQQLLKDARAKNIPIVWTRHGSRGVEDGGPFMRLRPFLKDGGLRQNSWAMRYSRNSNRAKTIGLSIKRGSVRSSIPTLKACCARSMRIRC